MAKAAKRKAADTTDNRKVKKAKTSKSSSSSMRQAPRGFLGARGEAKYVDVANAIYPLNTTGSVTHLNIVPQGTTVSSRVGKNALMTSMQLRGTVACDTTTTVSDAAVYLVWDHNPNKALAAITDILDAASSFALPKRENTSRFKFIKKWRFALTGNITTPQTGKELYDIDDYVRMPSAALTEWTTGDTTGVIGNCVKGALLLVCVGVTAAGTADGNLQFTGRINFKDE